MAAQPIAATNTHLFNHSSHLVLAITTLLERNLNPLRRSKPPDPSFLNQFSPILTHGLVIQIVKTQSSPHYSHFFFNWASNLNPNPNNYFHNFHCYIAITNKLISHNLFYSATQLLVSHGQFCGFMVGKFIKAHGDLGHLRWAVDLFHQLKVREPGCCLFSYNALLGVLVKASKLPLALGYIGQMVKEGAVKPDVSTYAILIRGFCQVGKIHDAKKVFDEMTCEKNLYVYNSIVDGLCKKGLTETARGVINEMVENGVCLPDMVTYTTLIGQYGREGKMVEAMGCFDEMVERNVEPNVITYNALINGLCLNGNVDEAKRMLTKMRLKGLKDNLLTHMCLLKGYSKSGRSNEAIDYFKEMVSLGMELDEKIFSIIVKEYSKLRMPNEAISILREMMQKGMDPAVYGFNTVLRCFLEMDEIDKAIGLLKQMPQMGIHPNFMSYSTVINGLVTLGKMQDVKPLLANMLQAGNKLDATLYNCLIKAYCEDGDEEMAMQLLLKMIDDSYVISVECFDAFAKKLYAKGKIYEVHNIFQQLKKRSSVSDISSHQKILDAYS